MNYLIDARLEGGRPQLRLVDARTGVVRLQWSDSGDPCSCGARTSLRQLFKALTLLACADRLSLVERALSQAFGEECLDCTVCVDREEPLLHWPARNNVVSLRDAQRTRESTTHKKPSGTRQAVNTTPVTPTGE